MGLSASVDWCGKSRPTGIRSPDLPARRQSLYRLRYPAHTGIYKFVNNTYPRHIRRRSKLVHIFREKVRLMGREMRYSTVKQYISGK